VTTPDPADWNFPYEAALHDVFPALHEAQNAWMSQIDSLRAPDRKTHELIRMVCTVIARNPEGIVRHAMHQHRHAFARQQQGQQGCQVGHVAGAVVARNHHRRIVA